jgi:uncharacterized membrane protein
VRTAVSWHVAYALFAYAGALLVAKRGADNAVAHALQQGGHPAVIGMALVLWWGGVALTTALWWAKVRQLRRSS